MIVLPNCEVLRPDLGYLVVNRAVATGYFVLKKLFTIKHEVFHHQPRNQNVSSFFPFHSGINAEAPDANWQRY
jgi:hypothetical protein